MLRRRIDATIATVRCFSANALLTEKPSPVARSGATSTSSSERRGGGDTLGRRLFSLTYAKRSAVVAMRKWKEEGHTIRKFELNRIVRELRKLKRYKHALEVCEWMRVQDDIKLVPGDHAVHLDLIAKLRGLNSAEKFFEDLPEKMKAQPTCTALLHTYVQHKAYDKAEALMDKMSECGFLDSALPFNHMMTMYIANGQLDKVPGLIEELKKNTTPDAVTYNLWLTVCASNNDLETAEQVFLEMKKAKVEPDWVTQSIFTNLYSKNGLNEKAASTLKEMERKITRKNRGAFPSLLSLHTNVGDKEGVHRIWNKMKSLFCKMSDAEYICMIASLIKLGDLEEAEKLYAEWESISPTGDSRVPNLLLAAYINKNQMETANSFYDRMVQKGIKPSYTTWELLTWGYLKEKQMDQVLDCFEKAVGSVTKWEPDEKIVQKVYDGLEEEGNFERAEKLLVILRKAGYVTTEIYKMLLRTYAKANKMPLVVAERMKKDKVDIDEETSELIRLTSKMCVGEVSSCLL
ncbi:hypothetical protein Ancab_019261 [Ancistrocladus abbreviatus]